MKLEPFQTEFLMNVMRDDIRIAAMSVPRGNGKSFLAAHIACMAIKPGGALYRAGSESVLCAASMEQARIVLKFAMHALEDDKDFRFLDSAQRMAITHVPTRTRLRVMSRSGKGAMGLGSDTTVAIGDEPGAWESRSGEVMYDALSTALGKPGSNMKIVLIGTLAPSERGWWHDLIAAGSNGTTHVTRLQGNPDLWDSPDEIRRVNPLTAVSPSFLTQLLQERDASIRDERKKAAFLSYRLNLPSRETSELLLTPDDWRTVLDRPVQGRAGRPIIGVDMGGSRAWSAIVAIWPASGHVEAFALCGGIPSIADRERRDRVPVGLYQRLVDAGVLKVAEDRRQPRGDDVAEHILPLNPTVVVCDRFRLAELKDACPDILIEPRATRWSESSEDIRALRQLALDGNLNVSPDSRDLLTVSLQAALVENDTSGNSRLVKKGTDSEARDDVANALVLASGELVRRDRKPSAVPDVVAYAPLQEAIEW